MRILVCSGFVVSVMALVAPAGALAQAVTSFDGTYAGASLSASGATAACSVKSPIPAPLIISGGNARTQQGEAAYQGSVNAQGVLQLHTAGGHADVRQDRCERRGDGRRDRRRAQLHLLLRLEEEIAAPRSIRPARVRPRARCAAP